MKIRTKQKEHEVKIKWQGKEWQFTVLPMDPEESNALLKKYTGYEMIKGQLMPDTDFLSMKIEKVQKTIKAWPCTDEDDNPIDCNDENKKTAFLLNPDLINLVMDKAAEIASGIVEIKEEEKKTS